jgi:hypothetical protein
MSVFSPSKWRKKSRKKSESGHRRRIQTKETFCARERFEPTTPRSIVQSASSCPFCGLALTALFEGGRWVRIRGQENVSFQALRAAHMCICPFHASDVSLKEIWRESSLSEVEPRVEPSGGLRSKDPNLKLWDSSQSVCQHFMRAAGQTRYQSFWPEFTD